MEAFFHAGRRIAEHGLVVCGSGNLSCRADDGNMLISATGAWLAELTRDQVALCRVQDGFRLNEASPSVELGIHSGILRARKDVNVVLHFQSPFATVLACQKKHKLDQIHVTPETPYYIGTVAVVPYLNPGSTELAEAVTAALRDHDLASLQNHGQVTVGRDYREALQRAVHFEFASEICLRGGGDLEVLGEEAINSLIRPRKANRDPLGRA